PPWLYYSDAVKKNVIYFTFIGISFFIQARISFSLWAIFLIREIFVAQGKAVGYEVPANAWMDQHLGSSVAYLIGMLWIGRLHWRRVIRQTLYGNKGEDEPGYRATMALFRVCV